MTDGDIVRHLLAFAVPLLLGDFFQQLYTAVDTWVVGNYVSNEAYSAIGSLNPIVNMIIGIFSGFSAGATVVVAQMFGAKQYDQIKKATHTSMVVTIVIGAVLSIAGVVLTPALLRAMKTPADVLSDARCYMIIYCYGLLFLLVYNMGTAILRAIGDSVRPFFFLLACSLLNIVLDLVFVLGLHMGVEGVAYATILSEAFSAVLVVISLCKAEEYVRLSLKEFRVTKSILWQEIRIGLPQGFQLGLTWLSNIFVQGYINDFGADFMAGYTTYNRVSSVLWLFMQSISVAATTFVAQNLGCGNTKRARKGINLSLILSISVTAILIGLVLGFRYPIAGFFNPKSEVVDYATMMMEIIIPFILFQAVTYILMAGLRGAGNSLIPMTIMVISFVVVRQLYLVLGMRYFSNTMRVVTFSYPLGWIICAIALTIYYLFNKPAPTKSIINSI